MNNLYKIILLTAFGIAFQTNAQIGIGKETLSNQSVLLEFGSDAKGILLPSVSSANDASPGTLILNLTDQAVQVLEGVEWKNLTDENQAIPHPYNNAGTDTGQGVILGASSSSKEGILILESTTQAMVLPQVPNPHLTMQGVVAGTLVYDTVSDMLAVYDGANWSYWK